jgi:D-threitol dehydrogenase (NAD+)
VTAETSAGSVDFDFRLDGKTALVTGAAAGIGAAIAAGYATKGARIAVVDLNETVAAQTASGLPTESRGFYCDVADPDSVRGTVDAVLDVFGRVDILVNSAGVCLTRRTYCHLGSVEMARRLAGMCPARRYA